VVDDDGGVRKNFTARYVVLVVVAVDEVFDGLANRFLSSPLSQLAAPLLIGSVAMMPSFVTRNTEK
jgi:hypothetical protein